MKRIVKRKVVTSGRLTGGVKVQEARRQVNPKPGPGDCPEPAYSLYSTDSEDQVTTLHEGLDRCATLLSGILQADQAEASPSFPRAGVVRAVKLRPSTPLGKKTIKKLPTKTGQRTVQPGRCDHGSSAPRTAHRSAAAHAGVKLHPPQKQCQTPCTPRPQPGASTLPPRSQTSTPSLRQTERPPTSEAPRSHCNEEEDEEVPVRDIDTQSTNTDMHSCTVKMSDMHLETGQAGDVAQRTHSREDCGETDINTVQYLLEELKALITGQGSVAERLLSRLEQAVTPPLFNVSGSASQAVSFLNQQLKEKETTDTGPLVSTVLSLQEELTTAQSRLLEIQEDLTELRKALQDTREQLSDREAENAAIRADLEATRHRLADSEREKSELAALAQQRLEEIGNLNRILQSRDPSDCSKVGPPADHITQYLMSLSQVDPTHSAPEQTKPRDIFSHTDIRSQQGDKPTVALASHPVRRQSVSTLSDCDVASAWSDWSMMSGSTFDTRDEVAFRDGLAALDASIASLRKTIQLDLRR
ncbi:uncharacterized protein ccdc14 [Mastacembelus armatus]|uniref:uncharacterized protein ccdc14 n=1 Tax=Mastacembelus armatus TaxID=205130 RepID=UPI000E461C66|nr:coiled-coil domain-containing protein 14 [Mastacembelus armatus]